MNTQAHDPGRRLSEAPILPRLLGNPLDFIREDHMRERAICAAIDDLAVAPITAPELADRVSEFLSRELPLHLADEEEDLFPLLRRRCAREDEIDRVLRRLDTEHRHAATGTQGVLNILARLPAGAVLSRCERAYLFNYASQVRLHLILENAIVLPLARARLIPGDLDTLRLRMMQRRGLDRLMEISDAQRPH